MNDKTNDPTNYVLPAPVSDESQPERMAADTSQNQPVATAARTATNTDTTSAPVAQDADLIEPEWVRKVEQLIAENVEDPKKLALQFSELKEQYMGSRYGKVMNQKPGGE